MYTCDRFVSHRKHVWCPRNRKNHKYNNLYILHSFVHLSLVYVQILLLIKYSLKHIYNLPNKALHRVICAINTCNSTFAYSTKNYPRPPTLNLPTTPAPLKPREDKEARYTRHLHKWRVKSAAPHVVTSDVAEAAERKVVCSGSC